MTSYVREIKSIVQEIKRLNDTAKRLKTQKLEKEGYLYQYMKDRGMTEIEGIKIGKICPKNEKIKRKKQSEKRDDALKLFRQVGVDDPESLWNRLEETRKSKMDKDAEEGDVIYVD
jgi:hypothetical protein